MFEDEEVRCVFAGYIITGVVIICEPTLGITIVNKHNVHDYILCIIGKDSPKFFKKTETDLIEYVDKLITYIIEQLQKELTIDFRKFKAVVNQYKSKRFYFDILTPTKEGCPFND